MKHSWRGESRIIQPPTGTATLMFTDIVGSTALRDALVAAHGETDGDRRYREQFRDPHNARIRALLEEHRGFEVKTNGDSFMVAFASAADAVLCAVEIQRSLRDDRIVTPDPKKPLAVRIGMHTGEATYVEREGKPDYDGHAVNVVARVEGLLKGGERIYCSRETATLAKTAPHVRFHSYGPYALKGLAAKVEIFDVLWNEAMPPEPPEQLSDTLPYPWLSQWVGREREMITLEEALRGSRLVTLHGTGGVGKTRLAVETLLARGGGLPRDVVFVSLEQAVSSSTGLLDALRDALGLTEVDAPDVPALCNQLHGGDRLLLLDNFESVMRDAGSVRRLATTPGVRILVTSQQVLGAVGEPVVKLEPMATNGELAGLESYQLFTGLARQRDASWQPDDDGAMREVLEATDGLPYLIELVAPVAPKRKLRQIANELKTRLSEVRSQAHDDLLKKQHESVLACLAWSFGRLPAEASEAMPRLAVFAGGFDAKAANAVAATPLPILDVLVDASLLRFDRESGRYSMLPTTRQFAQGLQSPGARAELALAHARWFIEHLDRADDVLRAKGGDAQRSARRWIDTDLENVQEAVAWAEANQPPLFARAVEAFSIYLRQAGRFSETVRLQQARLCRLDPEMDAKAWATTQNNLGAAYGDLPTGDRGANVAKAIACYEAALRVSTEQAFPVDWAMTQNNLGKAYGDLPTGDQGANLVKAIACFEAALRVRTEQHFPLAWAMTQNNLGVAYGELPTGDRGANVAKAISCFEAALRVRTEQDFPLAWAVTQNNLGKAYGELPSGDRGANVAKAIACFEAALRVSTEQDFPVARAVTQNNLGVAYSHLPSDDRGGNVAKEIACYEAALRVRTERDFPVDWAKTQYNLGNAYADLEAGDRGENVARRSRAMRPRYAGSWRPDLPTTRKSHADARQHSGPVGHRPIEPSRHAPTPAARALPSLVPNHVITTNTTSDAAVSHAGCGIIDALAMPPANSSAPTTQPGTGLQPIRVAA
jgi:class 3 adenylate cyclase/predicted ATPase